MYLHWPSLYGVILLCSALAAVYYHFFASAFELFNSVGYISNGKQPRPWLWQANGQAGASVGTKKPWCSSFLRGQLGSPSSKVFRVWISAWYGFCYTPPFFSLLSPSPCILLFPRWLARFYFSGFGYGVIAPFLLGEDDIGLRAMKLDERITYITMMF